MAVRALPAAWGGRRGRAAGGSGGSACARAALAMCQGMAGTRGLQHKMTVAFPCPGAPTQGDSGISAPPAGPVRTEAAGLPRGTGALPGSVPSPPPSAVLCQHLPWALPAPAVPRTQRPGIAAGAFLILSVPRWHSDAAPQVAGTELWAGDTWRAVSLSFVPSCQDVGKGCGDSPGLAAPPVLSLRLGGAQRQLHHLEEKPQSREYSQRAQGLQEKGDQGSLDRSEL